MIFSLICLSKVNLESSMRPKCFCSFTLATTVPLNISLGWLGLDFLQENKTSVACLVGLPDFPLMSPLIYNVKVVIQVTCRYIRIFNNREKHRIISKKLDIGSNILFKIVNVNKK